MKTMKIKEEWFQNFVILPGTARIISWNTTTLFLERAIFYAQLIFYLIGLVKFDEK